jgi:hypothetical protein
MPIAGADMRACRASRAVPRRRGKARRTLRGIRAPNDVADSQPQHLRQRGIGRGRAKGGQDGTRIDWTLDGEGILIAHLLPSRGELARKAAGLGRQWLLKGRDPIAELIDERTQADREEVLE